MDESTYSMYRVVPYRGDNWDGQKLAIIDHDGKIAELAWREEDKLVQTDFYDSEQNHQDTCFEMCDENPLKSMYRASYEAAEELLYEFDDEDDEPEWGEW